MNLTNALLRCCCAAVLISTCALADSVTIEPSEDNTLIQGSPPHSNGLGDSIFAGRTGENDGGTRRRGVLAFDVAGNVPAGATITSVQLVMTLTQTPTALETTMTLQRLLKDWGEGKSAFPGGMGSPSAPGDATWVHNIFPDQFWDTPGGDFVATISAQQDVGLTDPYTWGSTAQLVADVQMWLDSPATNFGWVLRGNEAMLMTNKRFGSRENEAPALRPKLTIEFTAPIGSCPGNANGDDAVDVFDVLDVLDAWGACADPCPPQCAADVNDDCGVDVFDMLDVLENWGDCP